MKEQAILLLLISVFILMPCERETAMADQNSSLGDKMQPINTEEAMRKARGVRLYPSQVVDPCQFPKGSLLRVGCEVDETKSSAPARVK
jgi:hypothetical protein